MAQLKDLIVNGASQLIGNVYTSQIQISKLNALTGASATTYGAGSAGQVLMSNGTNTYWGTPAATVTESTVSGWGFTKNAGTVTSVRVQATAPIVSSSSAAQTGSLNTTISLAKTTANYVLAGPSSGTTTAIPTYRKLVAADIPSLTKSKISDFPTSMPASDVSDWAKASTKPSYSITEISGAGNAKIFYGTCSTAAATTAKTVTCADFTSADLVKGAIIYVTFDYTNSGAVGSLTMSVNGTTAKSIKHLRNGTATNNLPGAGYLAANQTYRFIYDGTNWVTELEYDSNSNTLQRTYRSPTNIELPISAISTTASSTAAYSAISSKSYKDVYAAIPETDANRVMLNPSTGLVTFGQNGLKTSKIQAPTAAGGSTYGAGSSGQALLSNGTNVYWGTPDLSATYVKKSGDTMTGDLIIDDALQQINSPGRASLKYVHTGFATSTAGNTCGISFNTTTASGSNSTYTPVAVSNAGYFLFSIPCLKNGVASSTRFVFYQKSIKSADATGTNYYEVYSLPRTTNDLTANASYNILTTKLHFIDKTVATSAWSADSTYSGFSWKADIACDGVTATHIPNVIFDYDELISGNFCPFADSSADIVTIYCKTKPSGTITIPTIYCT